MPRVAQHRSFIQAPGDIRHRKQWILNGNQSAAFLFVPGDSRKEGRSLQHGLGCLQREDVYEVRAKTQIAVDRAHNQSEPTLLEIQTYRYYGHSVADANAKKYRTPEEIEQYKSNHDPLRIWGRHLVEEGILTETGIEDIDVQAKEETNEAVKFAEQSPFPQENEILNDVYWEVDHQTEAATCPAGLSMYQL
jgi:2-oxoglutarate dehydrogenase complex dehydrogenase (E1) component-like enzyme